MKAFERFYLPSKFSLLALLSVMSIDASTAVYALGALDHGSQATQQIENITGSVHTGCQDAIDARQSSNGKAQEIQMSPALRVAN
jgi:hypothetical protein